MTHEQKLIILQNVSIFSSREHHVAKNIKRFESNFSCFDFSIGAINANKRSTKQDFQNPPRSGKWISFDFLPLFAPLLEKECRKEGIVLHVSVSMRKVEL